MSLQSMSKANLIKMVEDLLAQVEQYRPFGTVEVSVRAALAAASSTPGGVRDARAALALSMARLIDDPPDRTKLSEIASASKELRATLKELALDGTDDEDEFFDDLPAPVGNGKN